MKTSTQHGQEDALEVPILARIWHEDLVWNVSAFDLPIVAYGDNFEDARSNFEEAVGCHFDALAHFGTLEKTVSSLRSLAEDRQFWSTRIKPRETVEMFRLPSHPLMELHVS